MTVQEAFERLKSDLLEWITNNLSNVVPSTRKVNGKALSSDINLTPSDIGADALLDNAIDYVNERILTQNVNVYVSTSGSDTNGDGTESKPWRTISKAVKHAPIARPSNDNFITYTVNIAGGSYTENIQIYEKKISFNLLGTVSFNASDLSIPVLSLRNGARLSISTNTFNVDLNISGNSGISLTFGSYLVMDSLNALRFSNITKQCIYCSQMSHVYFKNNGESTAIDQFIINQSTMENIVITNYNSSAVIHTNYLVISESTVCNDYAFSSRFNSYLYLDSSTESTIPSTVSKGIGASNFGIVDTRNIKNNATQNSTTGGVIQ